MNNLGFSLGRKSLAKEISKKLDLEVDSRLVFDII